MFRLRPPPLRPLRSMLQRRAVSIQTADVPAAPLPEAPASAPFVPRLSFPYPRTIPSWYAGHMYRAMRSLPALLARQPPPLVVEVRDARLPLSSINPAFEMMLRQRARAEGDEDWRHRRLVVYAKRDLVDPVICEPLREAFRRHGDGQEVLFVDTRRDSDVRKILQWVHARAAALSTSEELPASPRSLPRSARAQNLTGAFKHTPTPEVGARLVIVGSPNVGKSSLLNALRRVGTGKGKAASTAPEPGHTRKLTGTVRITKAGQASIRAAGAAAKEAEIADESSSSALFQLGTDDTPTAPGKTQTPVYVYDTPGIMVPYLGRGASGAEKGIKLAVAAGMKSSLFDVQVLVDYLLFRLNLRHGWAEHQWRRNGGAGDSPQPRYVTHLPMPKQDVASSQPTNEIAKLLSLVAERAPGTMGRGGERDLDGAAAFVLQRWREGKLGAAYGELDLGLYELPAEVPSGDVMLMEETEDGGEEPAEDPEARRQRLMEELKQRADPALRIDALVWQHFQELRRAERAGVGSSLGPARGAGRDSRRPERASDVPRDVPEEDADARSSRAELLMSRHQSKKLDKAQMLKRKAERLRAKGIGSDTGSGRGTSRLRRPMASADKQPRSATQESAKIPGRLRAAAAHGARRPLSALLKSKRLGIARSRPSTSARGDAPARSGKPARTAGAKRASRSAKPTPRR